MLIYSAWSYCFYPLFMVWHWKPLLWYKLWLPSLVLEGCKFWDVRGLRIVIKAPASFIIVQYWNLVSFTARSIWCQTVVTGHPVSMDTSADEFACHSLRMRNSWYNSRHSALKAWQWDQGSRGIDILDCCQEELRVNQAIAFKELIGPDPSTGHPEQTAYWMWIFCVHKTGMDATPASASRVLCRRNFNRVAMPSHWLESDQNFHIEVLTSTWELESLEEFGAWHGWSCCCEHGISGLAGYVKVGINSLTSDMYKISGMQLVGLQRHQGLLVRWLPEGLLLELSMSEVSCPSTWCCTVRWCGADR